MPRDCMRSVINKTLLCLESFLTQRKSRALQRDRIMKFKYLLTASAMGLSATAAHAQSTGSVDFEESEIIVTGSATTRGVEGVIVPDTTKAKQVLTQEQLARNNPGQTVLDSINIIPGVSFTNND